MNKLLLPFRIIYKIYYLILFSVAMLIMFPIYYYLLRKPKRHPAAFRIMRIHAFLLVIFSGSILTVKGKENIPARGSFIICSNHTSFLDSFCIYHLFSRYFVFVGKKEIEKWPLFHIFYTSGMNILVDRERASTSFSALKRMSREIDKGIPLAIFPEGTRPKNPPKLGPFKSGAFAIAIQKQIPILPVSFVDNWKRLGRGGFFTGKAGPGICKVVIHQAVSTIGLKKDDLEKLQERIRRTIASPLSVNEKNKRRINIPVGHFPKVSS